MQNLHEAQCYIRALLIYILGKHKLNFRSLNSALLNGGKTRRVEIRKDQKSDLELRAYLHPY